MIFSAAYTIFHLFMTAIEYDILACFALVLLWRASRKVYAVKWLDAFMYNTKFFFPLFPFFYVFKWVTPPLLRYRHSNYTRYLITTVAVQVLALVLTCLVSFGHVHPVFIDIQAVVYIFGVIFVVIAFRNDGGWHRGGNNDEPAPIGPTPTGDRVEEWLRSLLREPVRLAI